MSMKLWITGKEQIMLTDYTIFEYKKIIEHIQEFHDYVSLPTVSVELFGRINAYGDGEEDKQVEKLLEWIKREAYEEDAYRELKIELYFIDNAKEEQVYQTIYMKKAFVVKYQEDYEEKKGYGKFCLLLREFDHTEESINR